MPESGKFRVLSFLDDLDSRYGARYERKYGEPYHAGDYTYHSATTIAYIFLDFTDDNYKAQGGYP